MAVEDTNQYTAQVVLGRGDNRAISFFLKILFEGYTVLLLKHGSNAIEQACDAQIEFGGYITAV